MDDKMVKGCHVVFSISGYFPRSQDTPSQINQPMKLKETIRNNKFPNTQREGGIRKPTQPSECVWKIRKSLRDVYITE